MLPLSHVECKSSIYQDARILVLLWTELYTQQGLTIAGGWGAAGLQPPQNQNLKTQIL
jgi:hypothetical protein